MSELSEQEILRREALSQLHELNINPYPAAKYCVTAYSNEIHDEYETNPEKFNDISIAGRIMSRRIMGAASFVEIQDAQGRVQVYFKRDDLCPDDDKTLYNTVFKKLLDIGDIIGVKGFVFKTQTEKFQFMHGLLFC